MKSISEFRPLIAISNALSRRAFLRSSAIATAGAVLHPVIAWSGAREQTAANGPAKRTIPLDRDWLFGGRLGDRRNVAPEGDAGFARVDLPHCVAKLSWENWDPAAWQDVWLYRRRFSLPEEARGMRVRLHFDGVMVGAAPTINDHPLPQHLGGYLPFEYEITEWVHAGENTLDVAVDCNWSNVPPEGAPSGAKAVDYLEAGGIYRSVRLDIVPHVYIADVFAKPVRVLEQDRRIDVQIAIDASSVPREPVEIACELRDGARVIARVREAVHLETVGANYTTLQLTNLGNVSLWSVDAPHLYDVVTTMFVGGKPTHDYRVRIGLRDTRFELDGFSLNGSRLQLFGLNRHEIYPYVGGAMPPRVTRRDAQILRHELNCNVVRCSHYPQSEAFLHACDEVGLMVWEEVPGWWYMGDHTWQDLLIRDVQDMILRDRNHPSIVIWGVRANETINNPPLYARANGVAKALDDSRPVSGSMTPTSRQNWETRWHEDVFAYDDYLPQPDGSVGIEPPVPGVPYMLSEAVGQLDYSSRTSSFAIKYRRAGDVKVQQLQAVRHAQAHSRAADSKRICGVIAWCGFDYESLINSYHTIKTPGVMDIFRIPKLGASFYRAQRDPKSGAVIEPSFNWDFDRSPQGPGDHVAIFSNCDRLEVFIGGKHHATLSPDATFAHLKHPPFFVDLTLDGSAKPELRIDGYVGDKLLLSRSFSSDKGQDRLYAAADDAELVADASDATRLVFQVVDKFGAGRVVTTGSVGFDLTGPGVLIGDNPFVLEDAGGAGAVWIRTLAGRAGTIRVNVRHSTLGTKAITIAVRPEN